MIIIIIGLIALFLTNKAKFEIHIKKKTENFVDQQTADVLHNKFIALNAIMKSIISTKNATPDTIKQEISATKSTLGQISNLDYITQLYNDIINKNYTIPMTLQLDIDAQRVDILGQLEEFLRTGGTYSSQTPVQIPIQTPTGTQTQTVGDPISNLVITPQTNAGVSQNYKLLKNLNTGVFPFTNYSNPRQTTSITVAGLPEIYKGSAYISTFMNPNIQTNTVQGVIGTNVKFALSCKANANLTIYIGSSIPWNSLNSFPDTGFSVVDPAPTTTNTITLCPLYDRTALFKLIITQKQYKTGENINLNINGFSQGENPYYMIIIKS